MLQYLLVPVDKHVAAYELKTWNVAFELTERSIKEVSQLLTVTSLFIRKFFMYILDKNKE